MNPIFKSFLLIGIILTNFTKFALANNVSTNFDKRENYINKTQLGDPSLARKITDPNPNVSNLSNLNDSSLVDKGREQLRSSSTGKFLQNSEEKKIDAMERYRVNSSNSWLKNSLAIEEDPMSKTGGKNLSVAENNTSTKIEKVCVEGVDFNVDVGIELILEIGEEEYLGPTKSEFRKIRFPGSELHDSKMDWGYAVKTEWKNWDWLITPYHPKIIWVFGLDSLQLDSPWKERPDLIIADARAYIASKLGVGIHQIREDIVFPPEGRGIGNQGNGPRWRKIWHEYEFGYYFIWQEVLKKLVEKNEYWQVVTEGMEALADSNECYEIGRTCLKSGIKNFLGKYDIYRPCWYENVKYQCTSEPKNGCLHLMKQGCNLKDSTCEHKIGNICLKWKRKFECGGNKKELIYSSASSPIYCLGGNCHRPVIEADKDFANVAYLAALNEAKKDCTKESNGICKNPITIFSGEVDNCRKIITGFINCCTSMKGWAKDVNLCKCNSNEKNLAMKREKGLCHTVGTYCSQKDPVLKKCLVKKTNYCCFNSKLARIFQEQGRLQLGIGWGTDESPNCQPLTLEQLTKLDFSKFDLEELFDALLSKGKSNMNKSFPTLKPNEVPQIQKDKMNSLKGNNNKRDLAL